MGEGGIAHPGIAVVPVAYAADLLRQPAGRRGDNRARRRECQKLHLAPTAGVVAFPQPLPPEGERLRQGFGSDQPRLEQVADVAVLLDLAQGERGRLAGVENELNGNAVALPGEWKAADERDFDARRLEDRPAALEHDAMRATGEVERRPAIKAKANRPAHCPHDPNDLMDLFGLSHALDRHEIHDLAHALAAQETRHQDVAVRHVHLLVLSLIEARDAERSSLLIVEDRREDAWRVEVG